MSQMHAREALYRHTLHSIHKNGMTGLTVNAGSPSADPSFNPQGATGGPNPAGAMGQFNPNLRPNMMPPKSMMPPPSPAMGGPSKDGNLNLNKDGKNPDGSPRNPPGQPIHSNINPATPVPQGQAPGQGTQPQMSVMAPSPSALLNPSAQSQPNPGAPQQGMGQQQQQQQQQSQSQGLVPGASSPPDIFTQDFIQNIANSLDVFGDNSGFLRSDGDINFEREFGQWFNGEDNGAGLDMK